jgi:hypothetical protein
MKYYVGSINKNKVSSLDTWERELKAMGAERIGNRGYDNENYYLTVKADKKPTLGKFTWLKDNKDISELDAIWYNPSGSAEMWISEIGNPVRPYVIQTNKMGIHAIIQDFKTLKDAVNHLREKGYIRDKKKEWLVS